MYSKHLLYPAASVASLSLSPRFLLNYRQHITLLLGFKQSCEVSSLCSLAAVTCQWCWAFRQTSSCVDRYPGAPQILSFRHRGLLVFCPIGQLIAFTCRSRSMSVLKQTAGMKTTRQLASEAQRPGCRQVLRVPASDRQSYSLITLLVCSFSF